MTAPGGSDGEQPGGRRRAARAGRGRTPKAAAGKRRTPAKRPRPAGRRGGAASAPEATVSQAPARPPASPDAPTRQHPSAPKLIAAVALIVALDILLFFAIGYVVGGQIL